MKKTAIALSFVLLMLLAAMAEPQFINLGSANPGFYLYPHSPQTIILVQSPENNTTHNANSINVNLTLDVSTWALAMEGLLNPNYSFSSSAICYLDSDSVWEKTVNSAQVFNFSVPLAGLSEGPHKIVVNATATGQHYSWEPKWGLYDTPVLDSSGIIYFTVDTVAPRLSILSLENRTYFSPSVDLNFTVNDATSQVTYSLDQKENVTISENTQVVGLANGDHNMTVYAMDEAGNVASQTVYFKIAEPFPVVAVSVAAVALVAAGLLLYNRKRRKEAQQT